MQFAAVVKDSKDNGAGKKGTHRRDTPPSVHSSYPTLTVVATHGGGEAEGRPARFDLHARLHDIGRKADAPVGAAADPAGQHRLPSVLPRFRRSTGHSRGREAEADLDLLVRDKVGNISWDGTQHGPLVADKKTTVSTVSPRMSNKGSHARRLLWLSSALGLQIALHELDGSEHEGDGGPCCGGGEKVRRTPPRRHNFLALSRDPVQNATVHTENDRVLHPLGEQRNRGATVETSQPTAAVGLLHQLPVATGDSYG